MGFSAYLAGKLIAQYLNAVAYAWPATVYVALFTAQPVSGAGGTEANYTGYARQAMTAGTTDWTAESGGSSSNAIKVQFPDDTGTSQVVVGFGIYDALTAGNLLDDVAFSSSKTINTGAGNGPSFAIGALVIAATIAP